MGPELLQATGFGHHSRQGYHPIERFQYEIYLARTRTDLNVSLCLISDLHEELRLSVHHVLQNALVDAVRA